MSEAPLRGNPRSGGTQSFQNSICVRWMGPPVGQHQWALRSTAHTIW